MPFIVDPLVCARYLAPIIFLSGLLFWLNFTLEFAVFFDFVALFA
jgi:hypothetical protein